MKKKKVTRLNKVEEKEMVLNDFIFSVKSKLDLPEHILLVLRSQFSLALSKYNLVKKGKYEVVVSENTNEFLWKKFFIGKRIENLSENSLKVYKDNLERFDSVIKKNFLDVTTEDVRFYIATVISKNSSVKETYLDNIRRFLKTFFQFLVDEGLIKTNPVTRIKPIRGNTSEKLPFSNMEIEKLRNACSSCLEKAVIEILISTAFRRQELAEIKLSDIDFEKGSIRTIGKGKKLGYGFLNAKALLALIEYIEKERESKSVFLFIRGKNKRFREKAGEPYDASSLYALIKKIGKKAGVTHVHPHRFRRTAATKALDRGLGLEDVKELLRHEDIKTTLIYTTLNKDRLKDKHNRFLD